jgi:outer membrane receptor protein involved in Fe transport
MFYTTPTSIGRINVALGGTYLLEFLSKVFPDSQSVGLVGKLNYPVRLRLKDNWDGTEAGFGANVLVNVTDKYENNTVTPVAPIPSWTTVDALVSYTFDQQRVGHTILGGVELALSVQNLFDRPPPYIPRSSNFIVPIGYDSTNANPLGRFVSLNFRKSF